MSTPIVWTPSELYSGFLAVCGLIITTWAALEIIGKVIAMTRKPEKQQNERLKDVEEKVKEHEEYFERDKQRLDEIDDANRITQRSILALLKHAINGNDIDQLRNAQKELEDYLTDK